MNRNRPKFSISSWKLWHAGLALVMVPLICQVVAVGALLRLLDQAEAERKQEEHSKTVMVLANDIASRLNFLSVSLLTGLFPDSGALKFGEPAVRRTQISHVRRLMTDLKALQYDDVKEKSMIERFTVAVEASIAAIEETRRADLPGFEAIARQARKLSLDIQTIGEELIHYEFVERSQAKARNESRMILFRMLGVNFVIAILLALLFAKLVTERLARISDNSMRLAQGKPLQPQLYGEDEVARLDQVFHNMAAALSESARKERAVIDNAHDVICSLSADYKFIRVNPAAANAWGYAPTFLIGRNVFELIVEDDRAPLEKQMMELRNGTKDAIACETQLQRSDRSKHHALWSISYSEIDQSFFCVVHDITTRKELELLKEQFLSMASHDLKSPLNSVLSTMELIIAGRCGDVSQQALEKLRVSKRSVFQLTSLINNFLDIERLDAGELRITKSKQALAPIIEKSIEAVQSIADATMVEIDADGTDAQVNVDAERMTQVFVNLLSNAIKCSPKNQTVAITISDTASFVEVKIEDRGPGIPEELQASIFDRFKHPGGAQDDGRKGAGLGLAICKAIVEQHDGEIRAESEGKEGSAFYVRIPVES